jgi:hypothetical protein
MLLFLKKRIDKSNAYKYCLLVWISNNSEHATYILYQALPYTVPNQNMPQYIRDTMMCGTINFVDYIHDNTLLPMMCRNPY